jgi:hypothetical protein
MVPNGQLGLEKGGEGVDPYHPNNRAWACLLKEKTLVLLFIICGPRKTNYSFLFAENKPKLAVSVFHL